MSLDGSEIAALANADFGIAALFSDGYHQIPAVVIFETPEFDINGIHTDKPQIIFPAALLSGYEIKDFTVTINTIEYRLMKPGNSGFGEITAQLQRI